MVKKVRCIRQINDARHQRGVVHYPNAFQPSRHPVAAIRCQARSTCSDPSAAGPPKNIQPIPNAALRSFVSSFDQELKRTKEIRACLFSSCLSNRDGRAGWTAAERSEETSEIHPSGCSIGR